MGKNMQAKHASSSSCDKIHPNRKWIRVLHALDYHRWHYVKKMLAHKKHAAEESPMIGKGSDVNNAFDADDLHVCDKLHIDSPVIEEKAKASSPSKKGSRAARLKAMIAKEVSKKRGRHRRSSTCPASTSSDQLITSDINQGLPVELILDNEISAETTSHDEDTTRSLYKCELCRSMKIECTLGNKQLFSEEVNQAPRTLEKESRLRRSVSSADQLTRTGSGSGSGSGSKELLDAIDVLSLNKQFFLRVLEDPASSLAQNFMARQIRKKELTKSGSFPVNIDQLSAAGPTKELKYLNPSLIKRKRTTGPVAATDHQEEISNNSHQAADSCHVIISPHRRSNKNNNPQPSSSSSSSSQTTVARRFKDLRDKMKHVIRESRKDRQRRITMDAVLHKVPYGHKFNPDDIDGNNGSPQPLLISSSSSHGEYCSFSPGPGPGPGPGRKDNNNNNNNNNVKRLIRRTPSLDGSIDRYLHLFEASCNTTEPRHQPACERVKYLPADHEEETSSSARGGKSSRRSFGRMFSSPDLEFYVARRDHDNSLSNNNNNNNNNNAAIMSTEKADQNVTDTTSIWTSSTDNIEESRPTVDDEETKNNFERNIADDDHSDQCSRLASPTEQLTEPGCPLPVLNINEGHRIIHSPTEVHVLEEGPLLNSEAAESSSNEQEVLLIINSPTRSPNLAEPDHAERKKGLNIHQYYPLVDSKDEADFNYVRDILRISGYSRDQILGTWYSAEQPVDPSIFVELESCSIVEPDCSAIYDHDEEGTQCNHLLLFDLINEELLTIYERSISYWPSPLSSCSRMHPMPKGYRVLEEIWASISWYLGSRPRFDPSLDYVTTRDLAKDDGWMNLQFDEECVGLELEEFIFEDLIMEMIISS
ncbi:hypothetical protein Dimus_029907 [Dionaea muscipula]